MTRKPGPTVSLLCYRYGPSPGETLSKIERLLDRTGSTDFVLLPEDSLDPDGTHGEKLTDSEVVGRLQACARSRGVNLIGNVTEKVNRKRFSTSVVIDRRGCLSGTYSKVQLSRSDRELRRLQPGEKLPIFELEGVPFGLSVCYDLWYPETVRSLALRGALLVFAAFKEEAHYLESVRVLARARAIENLLFVACCGGGGWSRRFGLRFKSFGFVVLPSGRLGTDETRGQRAAFRLPDLRSAIDQERRPKGWERPFDLNRAPYRP